MKLRITLIMAAFGLLFAFTTCSTEITQEVIPQANLLALTVTTSPGTAEQRTIVVPVIPVPIPHTDWDDEEYPVVAAHFGTIVDREDGDTEKGVRLNPVVSPGARVTWGKARAGNRPPGFTDPRVTASFTYDDFVYLKVTADDGVTSNYYRFYSYLASPVKELAEISISGREAEKVPQPGASMETLIASIGGSIPNTNFYAGVAITVGEAARAVVNPVPQQADATFRYVVAQNLSNATPPEIPGETDPNNKYDWHESNNIKFDDGNILYVEVTAQNEKDKNYYAFRVTAGHIATIATLHLDNVEVVGKGTPARQWASVGLGAYSSADQRTIGFTPQIVLTDPDSVYDYQVIPASTATAPAGSWRNTGLTRIENGQQLAIRVRPAVAKDSDTTDMRFYRVQVTLLAANFTQQPKSAAYFVQSHTYQMANAPGQDYDGRLLVDDPANADKTITLDRAIDQLSVALDRSGTFTYQWYTANSWYGGYGFDKDGRIAFDPGVTTDSYHVAGSYDEKNNISLHNGGNNYYRLPYGGTAITGATTATYTPTISARNRPFLSGFSYQTQYYWVVVTDTATQYKVTSQRATILTEWGQGWNAGKPQGAKVDKKHYIVDLYAATDSPRRAEGLQGPPRNPAPFIAGNHGDKYLIPMALPAGFDIMEYSIVTAQAKFYLADGREWIQNWTQGDFGFTQTNGEQVLWYNLTNDNATRALSSSGNDPVGSSLSSNPTALEIRPAGTKPLKQMPPFQANGQPENNGDAQGWFTPYIEIVELRFEGPTRKTTP
jgi:hypothetical protein